MKKVNVNYVSRTKLLDQAIANIQSRTNMFKNNYKDVFYTEEYEKDYGIAGKAFYRIKEENDNDDFIFNVGTYRVDAKLNSEGVADFVIHFDGIKQKIKDIFILTEDKV